MQYRCPKDIEALFEQDETAGEGRRLAVEWAKNLDIKIGDEVWLPEIGWQTKTAARQDN